MRKDIAGNWIGKGEDSALIILQGLLNKGHFIRQIKLSDIIKCKDYPEKLSERQQKETIDILFQPYFEGKDIAVRVQDSRHRGQGLARADRHQRDILEACSVTVVDLHQNECPELFKERVNYISILEVCQALKLAKVKP